MAKKTEKDGNDELFVMDPGELPANARKPYRDMVLRLMQHEAIWIVVHRVAIVEFHRDANFQAIVRAKGNTDWVWLEEGLSAECTNNEMLQAEALRFSDKRPPGKHQASPRDAFETACYYAAFAITVAFMQSIHPDVRPPTWFEPIQALIQGRKSVPKDEAEVIRDLLLQGRDDEALAMLEFGRGARFYLHRQFWFDYHRHRLRKVPTFIVETPSEATDESDFDTAIGKAIGLFLTSVSHETATVRTSIDVDGDDAWDGVIVFAVAAGEAALKARLPEAEPLRGQIT